MCAYLRMRVCVWMCVCVCMNLVLSIVVTVVFSLIVSLGVVCELTKSFLGILLSGVFLSYKQITIINNPDDLIKYTYTVSRDAISEINQGEFIKGSYYNSVVKTPRENPRELA